MLDELVPCKDRRQLEGKRVRNREKMKEEVLASCESAHFDSLRYPSVLQLQLTCLYYNTTLVSCLISTRFFKV